VKSLAQIVFKSEAKITTTVREPQTRLLGKGHNERFRLFKHLKRQN